MISGKPANRHLPRSVLVALVALMGSAWAIDLDALLKQFSTAPESKARFTETRHLKILDAPLVSSGTLSFRPPDYLQKTTVSPKFEQMELQGNTLTVHSSGKKMQIQLSSQPRVEAIVDSIRGLLLGKRETLEKNYQIHLTGEAQRWHLRLTPKEERLSKIISSIHMDGHFGRLRRIQYQQKDGDSSVMEIEPLTNSPDLPAEQASGSTDPVR